MASADDDIVTVVCMGLTWLIWMKVNTSVCMYIGMNVILKNRRGAFASPFHMAVRPGTLHFVATTMMSCQWCRVRSRTACFSVPFAFASQEPPHMVSNSVSKSIMNVHDSRGVRGALIAWRRAVTVFRQCMTGVIDRVNLYHRGVVTGFSTGWFR